MVFGLFILLALTSRLKFERSLISLKALFRVKRAAIMIPILIIDL